MEKNYNSSGSSTLKSIGSLIISSFYLKYFALTLVIFIAGINSYKGQVNYSQTWATSGLNSWTSQNGSFLRTTTSVCATTGSVRANLYSSNATGNFSSPSLANNNGGLITMSYRYKVINYSGGAATPNTFGTLKVQYAAALAGPWTDVPGSAISTGHTPSTSCATITVTFTPPTGALFVRFNVVWNSGDYWMYFDEVSITQAAPVVPTSPPSCASTPTPANAATGVSTGTTLSWPAVSGATGYDVFFGTSATPSQVATNQAGTTFNPGALNPSTTYYWRVVPRNSFGPATGCTTWSFTTGLAGCLNVPDGLWPSATYTPSCNGSPEPITTNGFTGEYSNVSLTSGVQYIFSSSVATDYITISNATGTTILASGTSPLTWTSNVTGTVRFILHNNISCATQQTNRTRFIQCGTPSPPPSNDACANATNLPCGTSGLAGTTVNSVAETAPSACVGTNGVWYSFVGDGQVSTITVFSALDLGLYIGSGSCAGLTPIRCEDYFFGGTNETTSIITTSGVTYYVYVANYTGSTTGTFTISRTCNAPLSNDNCANAQSVSIQCPATATSVSGTTLNASEEPSLADPTCDDGLIRDVWYTFNSGPNTSVNLTATLGTATWLGGQIFTTCGTPATGLTIGGTGNCDFNLSTPNPTVISGLTTNTTYRLRLYTNDTYDTPGTFSFTLTNSVNNPGAVSVPASICAGTATSITNVTAATGAPGTVNYYFYYRGGPSNVGWQLYDGPTTNTSSSLPAAVINTPGTWFIARNSDFGCGQANNATTADLQLIVNSLPTVTANASSTAPCVGQNVTLTGGGATSYLWNNGVSNGVSFTPASTTTYTVTGTTGSCSGTAQVTVTLPTQGAALGNNSENATCTVNQAGWIHFYHSSGRLLASINSGGQNLGNVTVTSYVDGANAIVPACDMPSVETAVMQRHWVITPQFQPTSNVLVRLPFGSSEVSSLATAAGTTSNTQDNSNGIPNLKLSRYHGPANVNASALDNCSENGGDENTVIHSPSANGTTNAYSNVNGEHYNEYSITQFSEFWLHWQSDNTPLPVVLSNARIECVPASNQVVLEWTTSSELNSDKFLVQRSRDGELWETIGQEQGAGNSSSVTEYTFTDDSAFGGQSYYQIVQYDFDGTATVYGPWVTECSEKNGITVYPNPTAGKFVISIMSEEDQKDAILEIMDLSGKIISSEEVQIESGATEIYRDLSYLNAGSYLVVIRTTKGVFNPVRVVKGQ